MDFAIRYLIMCVFFVVILRFENGILEKHYILITACIFLLIGLIFLI